MAARKEKLVHDDRTKGEIKASQLLNRLFSCGNGEIEMNKDQIQAAKIFIGKYRADLKAIELSGNAEKPVEIRNCYEWLEPK